MARHSGYEVWRGDSHDIPSVGHVAAGGGATISNSPIQICPINISITIQEGSRLADDNGRPTELGKIVAVLEGVVSRFSGRESGNGRRDGGACAVADAALMEILSERMK